MSILNFCLSSFPSVGYRLQATANSASKTPDSCMACTCHRILSTPCLHKPAVLFHGLTSVAYPQVGAKKMKSRVKFLVLFFFLYLLSVHNVAFGYEGEGEQAREEAAGREFGGGGEREAGREFGGGESETGREFGGGGERETGGDEYQGGGSEGERGGDQGAIFVLPRPKQVMKGEAGEFRVVRGVMQRGLQDPMHIGFINMEPKSLLIPQYLDSSLVLFVRRGTAKIGVIEKDKLEENTLKIGDVFRVLAGSPFYIVNTDEGQILQMICSVDTSESLGIGPFQSFFIGGGRSPTSVLAGFDRKTLTTAFNVTGAELEDILTPRQHGPMVFLNATHEKELAAFTQLKQLADVDIDENDLDSWPWRKLFNSVGGENREKKKDKKSSDAYNLYDRKPDFENKYGSSRQLTQDDYKPLADVGLANGVGVYLVNLTAGAMMAPHVNPTATEYGVVLRGSGSIQVVFPNGTSAMNAVVSEGDVFFIPRYFPFCQIASRNGPFEFFGYTTSARGNRPQFLAGATSILQTMRGPELATAFGASEKRFYKFIDAQKESIILPSATASPPREPGAEGAQEEEEHQKERGGGSEDPRKQETEREKERGGGPQDIVIKLF